MPLIHYSNNDISLLELFYYSKNNVYIYFNNDLEENEIIHILSLVNNNVKYTNINLNEKIKDKNFCEEIVKDNIFFIYKFDSKNLFAKINVPNNKTNIISFSFSKYYSLTKKYDINDIQYFYTKDDVFSNFYPCNIEYQGKIYPTSEHLFQALKYMYKGASKTSLELAEMIRQQTTPYKAKILAGKPRINNSRKWIKEISEIILGKINEGASLRDNWDDIRYYVMYEVVSVKFRQNKELYEILKNTKGKYLCEKSPYDYFWGIGKTGKGKNYLGKILIRVRDEEPI